MSKIEWTERTWNPIVGCSIVSPGCTNCYAMRMAARLEAMSVASETRTGGDPGPLFYYRNLTQDTRAGAVWTGKVKLAPEDVLTKPLRWRKPRMIFVNSMSDLFHEEVPDEWIDRVFAVMALTPHHTYQVLTKRSARMRAYMSFDRRRASLIAHCPHGWTLTYDNQLLFDWPLPNVWLGVSAERQQETDERIPDLLATPAAVRFVSAEPLLGPIDFTDVAGKVPEYGSTPAHGTDVLTPHNRILRPQIDWIIVGGESGPNARPMHPDWARSIRDQCAAAGVPFFFKQWGEWAPSTAKPVRGKYTGGGIFLRPNGSYGCQGDWWDGTAAALDKVGKKAAGRLLDGRTWDEMPAQSKKDQAA